MRKIAIALLALTSCSISIDSHDSECKLVGKAGVELDHNKFYAYSATKDGGVWTDKDGKIVGYASAEDTAIWNNKECV